MVITLFQCEKCKTNFSTKDYVNAKELAEEHESRPVLYDNLKPGYVFKIDKKRGGCTNKTSYPSREQDSPELKIPEYGVVIALTTPNKEHFQNYDIEILHGPWLNEDYNPFWTFLENIPGNSTLIEALADEEFDRVKNRLEYWVHNSQNFGNRIRLKEKLNLTNKL
jgi:hypothetical protein